MPTRPTTHRPAAATRPTAPDTRHHGAPQANATLIDEMAAPSTHGYDLQRTYRSSTEHHVYTIQVKIHRDAYEMQSYAVATVLSADLNWEPVAAEAASRWFTTTTYYTTVTTTAEILTQLEPIAARLLARAITILS
jgi:hypothetical protein